ncbi:hypothetical protein [Halococcus agarilyticus]|uniref:hypothetical protein n=1 Tax=Halococcus agarilyticus TaxID=1232219 RepID=UPI000677A8B6|nr:hypothetical protein [Halococcus agarilyticus]
MNRGSVVDFFAFEATGGQTINFYTQASSCLTETRAETTSSNGPGFGIVGRVVVALAVVALVGRRR